MSSLLPVQRATSVQAALLPVPSVLGPFLGSLSSLTGRRHISTPASYVLVGPDT